MITELMIPPNCHIPLSVAAVNVVRDCLRDFDKDLNVSTRSYLAALLLEGRDDEVQLLIDNPPHDLVDRVWARASEIKADAIVARIRYSQLLAVLATIQRSNPILAREWNNVKDISVEHLPKELKSMVLRGDFSPEEFVRAWTGNGSLAMSGDSHPVYYLIPIWEQWAASNGLHPAYTHMAKPTAQAAQETLACNNRPMFGTTNCDQGSVMTSESMHPLENPLNNREISAVDAKTVRKRDPQSLEQILSGHMSLICGEANQIYRAVTAFDYGIDGEVEFKGNDGKPSGKKIYVQLKSGDSHLRRQKADGREVFYVKNARHLEYWVSQPVDVYLTIQDSARDIRWMNITHYLKQRTNRTSRQIIFDGEKLDAAAVCRIRDEFFR